MCALFFFASPALAAACAPHDWTPASLTALKARGFLLADARARAALALGLVDCLGDPDPGVRDGIAYEGLSTWMRKSELPPAQLRVLRGRLGALLNAPAGDGFAPPFAALVLAEVARTDRIAPWMTPAERATMVERAATYVTAVRDYRGYDDRAGWRHGVAHGADWLLQLALNPRVNATQLDRIVDAAGAQVVPAQPHAYVFGEPERLARPVLYAAQRGFRDEAAWTAWLAALPGRIGDPGLAYRDSAWLARRHDLLAFLQALYVNADASDDARFKVLLPGVTATLKSLP
ncbi:DUF2785 domain-containing protein [Lysobacter koreensis]|uniref:DUF2785 domain-containing protein n=1 Tax=Lysobacter koreensis TaxID=266122 RepID=A0ABW2YVF8_9GAMM